jgi:hypothetical protein
MNSSLTRSAIVSSLSLFFVLGCASHEVPVTIDQVPAAVRATLTRESTGGKITEVEKEIRDGKNVYSADITLNGEEWDLTVAEDGSVISKEKEGPAKK